jgi:uncharacterized membrane protein (DUF4010 family)
MLFLFLICSSVRILRMYILKVMVKKNVEKYKIQDHDTFTGVIMGVAVVWSL